MKKIAICIPSYNESENIENITLKIDKSLEYFEKNFIVEIINCDNNSPDLTNKLFESVKTKHKKVSIVTSEKGKGINLLNFFEYFLKNNFDYGFTIDADLKSFKFDWLPKMYTKLKEGNNLVLPLYKRRKEEGNTTNHFVLPMLYEIYGKFYRQPIGGDYAFDKKYVEKIMKQKFTKNILLYGIDIFMVVTAIVHKLKIDEVYLGEKKHSPSYNKMENIFESVLRGFSEVYKQYGKLNKKDKFNYKTFKSESICEFRKEFDEKYIFALNKSKLSNNYEEILKYWNSLLIEYKNSIGYPSEDLIKKMKYGFIARSVSFWDEMSKRKEINWEEILLKEIVFFKEEKNEIKNN